MNKVHKSVLFLLLFTGAASLLTLIVQPLAVFYFKDYIALLFPAGSIALEERNLLFLLQGLMLIIVIPVYILTFIFAWKYRAGRDKERYDPDLVDHKLAEVIWWGAPLVLTGIICVITWVKTYELDPFKPIKSDKKELVIQVVALQWKWLFIYPEEGVASVNFLQIPKDRPIRFEITADAPMNSFWIPHLGSQIYAMPKMKSILYLTADKEGDYRGCSANISGDGFAEMHFITRVVNDEAYTSWTASASETMLDYDGFEEMVKPSVVKDTPTYKVQDANLFEKIYMKYMHPKGEHHVR